MARYMLAEHKETRIFLDFVLKLKHRNSGNNIKRSADGLENSHPTLMAFFFLSLKPEYIYFTIAGSIYQAINDDMGKSPKGAFYMKNIQLNAG